MTQFVVIDVETGEREGGLYNSGAIAALVARQMVINKGRRYRVVRVADETNESNIRPAWQQRELNRFVIGDYKRVPWHDETWSLEKDHFAHVSKKHPSKLAFTRDSDHGERDIQTIMRPGRYLTTYYDDKLSADDIRKWCSRYASENEELELRFATTPDEIEDVYTHGPRSCMSHSVRDYDSSVHPVRVYGAGDLAIAYLEDDDNDSEHDGDNARVTARCICWPKKMIYGRIYGDDGRLSELLKGAGYSPTGEHDFNGARLLRIEDDGTLVAPYLDHIYSVNDNGEYLVLSYEGEIDCQNTNGLARCGVYCDCCNEHTTGETYNIDGETYCEYCYENNSFCCDGCHCQYAGENSYLTAANGNSLCESCASDYSCCADCDEYHRTSNMCEDIYGDLHCDNCARNLETTHCGMLARDVDDCRCYECETWREEHVDLFGNVSEQNAMTCRDTNGPVVLKETSPTIADYRQIRMFVVRDYRQSGYMPRYALSLSMNAVYP